MTDPTDRDQASERRRGLMPGQMIDKHGFVSRIPDLPQERFFTQADLDAARQEGRREAIEECARIADEIRHVADNDRTDTAGVWRLACSEISQRIRHGDSK